MDRKQRLFVYLTGIFVAALLVSDLIGGKFFRVGGLDFSVGMIPFPLTFLLTDIVNEFYGTEGARRLTYVGLVTALFVFAVINLAIALPTSPESPLAGDVFKNVIGCVGPALHRLAGRLPGRPAARHLDLLLRAAGDRRAIPLAPLDRLDRRLAGHRLAGGQLRLSLRDQVDGLHPAAPPATTTWSSWCWRSASRPLIYLGHGVLHRYLHVKEVLVNDPVPPQPAPDEPLPT